ncbi:hypothetical protein RHDC4_02690 [Rhodocyclaceae bacterium]|nr:hypothetical protein RHDC4_02690 [Rhodocyclaceae bacterium]
MDRKPGSVKTGWQRTVCLALVATMSSLVTVACRDSTKALEPLGSWSAAGSWEGRVVITDDQSRYPADAVTIVSATIDGDTLNLTVSYGGGCSDHAFGMLAGTAWMESYPVQIGMRLAHDAHGDACDALLTRTLRFDLTPLKTAYAASYHSATGIMTLRITGSSLSPTYSF